MTREIGPGQSGVGGPGMLRLEVFGELVWDAFGAMPYLGDACAICRRPFGDETPHIDHSHETGETRGLLCSRCNRVLGFLDDDPDLIRAAAAYLEGQAAKRSA